MFKVSDETVENVAQTYKRSPQTLAADVQTLVLWMQEQPHFPEILDSRSVKNFLLLNKFSIERTKQKIDYYYTFKTKAANVYGQINPSLPHMEEYRKIIYLVAHPRLLDNNRVFFFKMRDKNLAHSLDPMNTLRHLINVQEIRMREDVVDGEVYLVDCADIPLSYYTKLTPSFLFHSMVLIFGKLYSARLKKLYFFNFPVIGKRLMAVAEKILKPKVFQRIKIVSNVEELVGEFSRDFLPLDFGGTGLCLRDLQEMLEKELHDHRALFAHLDQIRVEESLRPVGLENDEIFGFYGNFKQLTID